MLLTIRSLTKTFPGTKALDGVRFDLRAGEVHALLGENGAGKSTLVKMFYGSLEPDGGEILWQGMRARYGWTASPSRRARPARRRNWGSAPSTRR